MIHLLPPASEGVTASRLESVRSWQGQRTAAASGLPVVFPVSGVRAANVAHLLNYLLLPFRANRGQQEPKRLLPIILP